MSPIKTIDLLYGRREASVTRMKNGQRNGAMDAVLYGADGSRESAAMAELLSEMGVWGAWFGELGPAVVDAGNPTAPKAKSVSSDGSVHDGAVGTAATGYSILKAESLSQSVELAKACPVLTSGGKISVYEITPAM